MQANVVLVGCLTTSTRLPMTGLCAQYSESQLLMLPSPQLLHGLYCHDSYTMSS